MSVQEEIRSNYRYNNSSTKESSPQTSARTIGQACGRINLIGEHLDYNGGMVLPMSIDREVTVTMSTGEADIDEVHSKTFNDTVRRGINDEYSHHWSDYVGGALQKARELGFIEGGMRVTTDSNLPHGAGVSSSAAVIIATLRAARQLYALEQQQAYQTVSPIQLSTWAQDVENTYIGLPCGLMDQMAIAAADAGHALALNTKTLESTLIALPADFHFVGVFSGISRCLDEGRYAERRQECELAGAQLNVPDLCLMSEAQFATIDTLEPTLAKRAKHAYTEHIRVLAAIDAFANNDILTVGKLMTQSHESMRDDFEVSIDAIDKLVEGAIEFGAVGARLTGGGFGGCIVACVEREGLPQWRTKMQQAFPDSEFVN